MNGLGAGLRKARAPRGSPVRRRYDPRKIGRPGAGRLQLFALAYNLANFLRRLALPDEVAQWSLTTLRERLVKVGARVVWHGRYLVFQLAEVSVPRTLFAKILARIDRLRGPPVPAT